MNKIINALRQEPAIATAVTGVITALALAATEVIDVAGGELTTIILALLGAGVTTRQNVTPTAKT